MTIRLLSAFLALVTAVLVVLIVPLGIANQRSEKADLTRKVERDAVAAAAVAAGSLANGGQRLDTKVNTYLQKYAQASGARVVVVNATGDLLTDTQGVADSAGRSFSSRPEIAKALDGKVASGVRSSETLGYQLLYVAVPVATGGRPLGAVRVSYPTEELDERIARYWYAIAAIAFAVLAATSMLAMVLARWVVQPLNALVDTARAVGDGDLTARVDVDSGPPEIRALGEVLNESVATVEQLVNEKSRFVADAAHQLRTPLQALLLRLENIHAAALSAEKSSGEGGVAVAPADVERATEEVNRLSSLVTSLLVLERADQAPNRAAEEVDLVGIVEGRAADWEAMAQARDVVIELDLAKSAPALARPLNVEQVLDNLVDNAVSVSPAGAPVEVVLRVEADSVVVHVIDRGPGMSDEQISQAFNRFATTRPSRGSAGGFGLGLPIVQRLVELDGGKVVLSRSPRGGLDAQVSWPLVRQIESASAE